MSVLQTNEGKDVILLVGAGRMGGALLKGWIASKRFRAIHVVEPAPSQTIQALAAKGKIRVTKAFDSHRATLRAVVVALKPQVIKNETALLRTLGAVNALVVSIAAGVTTNFLADALGSVRIVRTMPNTAGAIGRGITALYAPKATSTSDRGLAESLMAPLGETLWLEEEELMDVVTALSGSGPAYVFLLAEEMAKAGIAEGLTPDVAARLARATVAGAGALLQADPRFPEELRRDVTSPGGTAEAALNVLTCADGLESLMLRAVAAARRRSRELGKA